MMSAADIRHVCERVLQPLRFPDPYSDDYYYIQVSVKRNAAAREAAIKEAAPLPTAIKIPQPIWRDVKERIRGQVCVCLTVQCVRMCALLGSDQTPS